MSCPRLRRTVTRTPSSTSTPMNRSNCASSVGPKSVPSTGLYMIRFTLLGAQRVTAARWWASATLSLTPANMQYSYVMRLPVCAW